ncbi:MAG: hypothetical protein ACFFC3_10095 [Candidatus Odinarchaeota archaeon]
MVVINIRCPICSKNRMLSIDEEQIKFKASGLCTLNIEENFTCEHSYIIFIDQHYNIRDYYDFDYNIELSEIFSVEEPKKIIRDIDKN